MLRALPILFLIAMLDTQGETSDGVALLQTVQAASPPSILHEYYLQLQNLVKQPVILQTLPVDALVRLQDEITVGGYLYDSVPKEDLAALRKDETILTALIIQDLKRHQDPTVNVNQRLSFSFPPYETITPPENQSDAGRLAYEADVKARMLAVSRLRDQLQLRRLIRASVVKGTIYLGRLYPDSGQVRDILSAAGIDQDTIDLLLGKTEFKVRQ